MTLDQRLTRAARQVAEGLSPPDVDPDGIRARARSNRRRRASLTAAAAVMVVIAVGVTVVSQDSGAPDPVDPGPTPVQTDTSAPSPDEPNPFPTSMTPEEVVHHPRAQLWTTAVAPDDPDTRMSLWFLECIRPCPEQGPVAFEGLALTTDGFETTTYIRPPFPTGVDLHVSSPADGLFLVNDQSNGGEWLVDLAGDVRRVAHVATEIRPADPRLWYQCVGHWRQTWCALDPATATAHVWPTKAWDGSAASPASGDLPWGANPRPRSTGSSGRLEVWWDTESGRQVRTLAAANEGDYILGTPPGEMALWARPAGTAAVEIHTSRDRGASWEVDTRPVPGIDGFMQMRRSPDGAFLAYSIYPRLVVWRAEASGGSFEKVYEQPGASRSETSGAGVWTQEGLVHANGFATAAVSEDDGLTWTTIQTWR